jgi:hypothetical protein
VESKEQRVSLQENVHVIVPKRRTSSTSTKSKSKNSKNSQDFHNTTPKQSSYNHETEYMKTVRQTDIKLIKKPETHKRCPHRYCKHPTNKLYYFRERNKKHRTIKKSRHGTMTLKQKAIYIYIYIWLGNADVQRDIIEEILIINPNVGGMLTGTKNHPTII